MAEQINKNDYINHPDRIGGFNYYSLGETTIKQLQQNNLISSKTRKFQNKKPDAIVTDDEKDIVVYIENKDIISICFRSKAPKPYGSGAFCLSEHHGLSGLSVYRA